MILKMGNIGLCAAIIAIVSTFGIGSVYAQGQYEQAGDPVTNTPKTDPACVVPDKGAERNPILLSSNFSGPKVGCTGSGEPWLVNVLRLVFGLMGTLSLLFVAIGAFKYTTSGGSSEAIASAKKTIIYALLGLVLGVSAFTIMSIVIGAVG